MYISGKEKRTWWSGKEKELYFLVAGTFRVQNS
jgi:hypothetical protein